MNSTTTTTTTSSHSLQAAFAEAVYAREDKVAQKLMDEMQVAGVAASVAITRETFRHSLGFFCREVQAAEVARHLDWARENAVSLGPAERRGLITFYCKDKRPDLARKVATEEEEEARAAAGLPSSAQGPALSSATPVPLAQYRTIFDAYIKVREPQKAEDLMNELIARKGVLDSRIYLLVVHGWDVAGDHERADAVVRDMFASGAALEETSLKLALARAITFDRPNRTKAMIDGLLRLGCEVRTSDYVHLLTSSARADNVALAEVAFAELMKRDSSGEVGVNYHAVRVKMLCRAKNPAKALAAFSEMIKGGFDPRQVKAIYSLLTLLAEAGMAEAAERVLSQITAEGWMKASHHAFCLVMTAYAKKGRADKAEEVLARMKAAGIEPDIIAYKVLISMWGKLRRIDKAEEVLAAMLAATGVAQPDSSVVTVMENIRRGAPGSVFDVGCDDERCEGGDAAALTGSKAIIELCNAGRVGEAEEVLAKMLAAKSGPSGPALLVLYNKLLVKRRAEKAEEVLSLLVEGKDQPLLSFAFNNLIALCGEVGRRDRFPAVLKLMEAARAPPNNITYNLQIVAWGKAGRADMAEAAFEDMQRAGLEPDVFTFNSLLKALCSLSLVDKAEAVYKRAHRLRVNANKVTYNTMLDMYCKMGLHQNAVAVVDKMRAAGHDPDEFTYHALMDMWVSLGDLDKAEEVMAAMRAANVSPKVLSYSILISGWAKSGSHERVENLLGQMSAAGVAPDEVLYNILIDMWVRAGCSDKAEAALAEMRGSGLWPTLHTYTSMMHLWFNKRAHLKAYELYQEMIARGFRPSRVTFNAVASASARASTTPMEDLMLLLRDMSRSRTHPDHHTFGPYIARFSREGLMDSITRVIAVMKAMGLAPNLNILNQMLRCACATNDIEGAKAVLQQMTSRDKYTDWVCNNFSPPLDCSHLPKEVKTRLKNSTKDANDGTFVIPEELSPAAEKQRE